MLRSDYEIVSVTENIVFLHDLDQGGRSLTNDAVAVVDEVLQSHPGKRIVYRDSYGDWAEMKHSSGRFVGYGPWTCGLDVLKSEI